MSRADISAPTLSSAICGGGLAGVDQVDRDRRRRRRRSADRAELEVQTAPSSRSAVAELDQEHAGEVDAGGDQRRRGADRPRVAPWPTAARQSPSSGRAARWRARRRAGARVEWRSATRSTRREISELALSGALPGLTKEHAGASPSDVATRWPRWEYAHEISDSKVVSIAQFFPDFCLQQDATEESVHTRCLPRSLGV